MKQTLAAIEATQDKPWTNEMAIAVKEAFDNEASPALMELALELQALAGKAHIAGPAPIFIIQAMNCRDWGRATELVAKIEGLV